MRAPGAWRPRLFILFPLCLWSEFLFHWTQAPRDEFHLAQGGSEAGSAVPLRRECSWSPPASESRPSGRVCPGATGGHPDCLTPPDSLAASSLADDLPCHFTSAFGAGFCTTVIASPVDVVKTRYMNSAPGQYSSAGHCALTMLQKEGPRAFYKG